MTDTIDLVIAGVPDDDAVKIEIMTNAETTIRNYLERTIKVMPKEVEAEYQAKIEEFHTANADLIESLKPVEVKPEPIQIDEQPMQEKVIK